MGIEHAFDLGGIHVLSAGDHHVLQAVGDVEESVFVEVDPKGGEDLLDLGIVNVLDWAWAIAARLLSRLLASAAVVVTGPSLESRPLRCLDRGLG
jgi:hypothetical protein